MGLLLACFILSPGQSNGEQRFFAATRTFERQIQPRARSVTGSPDYIKFSIDNSGRPLFHTDKSQSFDKVQLHFQNGKGAPIGGMKVQLFPVKDSHPIRGVQVDRSFARIPKTLAALFESETDDHGDVTFPSLPTNQSFSVTISAGPSHVEAVLDGAIRPGDKQSVTIDQTRSISGRIVISGAEKPVANARVGLTGPGYHNMAGMQVTDSDGRFTFEDLIPGKYYVMSQDPAVLVNLGSSGTKFQIEARGLGGDWNAPGSYSSIDVSKGSYDHADFRLLRSARLAVKLLGKTGKPVKNGLVEVDLPDGSGEGHTTDINGVAVFSLAPATYFVSAGPAMGARRFGRKELTVKEGQRIHLTQSIPR